MLLGLVWIFVAMAISLGSTAFAQSPGDNYMIFLHNRYLENHKLDDPHSEYGLCEYAEIIASFRESGFIVLSELRPAEASVQLYAEKTASQVDSLMALGVSADHITIIGTSKGGYMAQYASTRLANPDLNFVFIGCYRDADLRSMPSIQWCGNILSIYEKSDPNGVPAAARAKASSLKVTRFAEVGLQTGRQHGFLYKALPEWLDPCKHWARREYDAVRASK
jgi:hypothetical protein